MPGRGRADGGRTGGPRPGAGAPIRYIRIRAGDTFAAIGRAGLVTVVGVERGGLRLRFEGGEELALVERFRPTPSAVDVTES